MARQQAAQARWGDEALPAERQRPVGGFHPQTHDAHSSKTSMNDKIVHPKAKIVNPQSGAEWL